MARKLLYLALVLLLVLAACSKTGEDEAATDEPTAAAEPTKAVEETREVNTFDELLKAIEDGVRTINAHDLTADYGEDGVGYNMEQGKEAFFSTTDLVIPEGTNLVLADSCLVILKDHKLTVNGSVTVGLADGYASMLVYQNENVTLDTSNITVDCGYLFCNSSAALAETYFTQPNLSQLIVKEPYTLSHDLALQDNFLIDFTAGLTVDPGVTVTIPVAAQYKWRHIEFPFGGITVTGGTLTNNGTIHVEAGADISLGEGIPFDGSGTYTGDGIWPGKE